MRKKQNEMLNEIKAYFKELKIPGVSKDLEEKINDAYAVNMPYEELLHNILLEAFDQRKENGRKNRIRTANFPYKKYLEDLKQEYLPEDARKKYREITSLKFIDEGRNMILVGPPGTGKTHLSIGVGITACNEGYKVMFTTASGLINELKTSRSERRLAYIHSKFSRYDLVIIDELGYISFDKEGAELLFELMSLRAERKSTIITSNLSFDRWDEIFNDKTLTAAIIDRLTFKAEVLNMNASSYRMQETANWLKASVK